MTVNRRALMSMADPNRFSEVNTKLIALDEPAINR